MSRRIVASVGSNTLLKMVRSLQAVGHGDAGRLSHIADSLGHGRVIYQSDRQYVERKFAELDLGANDPDATDKMGRMHSSGGADAQNYVDADPSSGAGIGEPDPYYLRPNNQPQGKASPAGRIPPGHTSVHVESREQSGHDIPSRGQRRDHNADTSTQRVSPGTGRRTLFWVGIALIALGAGAMMMGPVFVFGGFGMVFDANVDAEDSGNFAPGDFIGMGVVSVVLGFPVLIVGIVMSLIGRRK